MTPAPGLVIAGRFRLVRPIGEGNMGEVWLADHLGLEIPCAVKVIRRKGQTTEEARVRFEREGKAAAQLRSPHVVQTYEYGVFEDTPYIVMEFLVGESLGDRLARVGRLSPTQTVAILGQIAKALTRAHKAGVVHRDLKPDNVFLARDDDEEIAKVVDFGVAKEEGLNLTKTGMLMGTPAYMSPEQAVGSKAVDHRADLWSLAVLAFECLTGQLPFPQPEMLQALLAIVNGPLPVLSHAAPDLPPAVDAWWKRAASRPPDGRFQSAKEQIEALAAALGLGDVRHSSAPPNALPAAVTALGPAPVLGATVAVEPLADERDDKADARPAAHAPRGTIAQSPELRPTPAPPDASRETDLDEAEPLALALTDTAAPAAQTRSSRGVLVVAAFGAVIAAIVGIAIATRGGGETAASVVDEAPSESSPPADAREPGPAPAPTSDSGAAANAPPSEAPADALPPEAPTDASPADAPTQNGPPPDAPASTSTPRVPPVAPPPPSPAPPPSPQPGVDDRIGF